MSPTCTHTSVHLVISPTCVCLFLNLKRVAIRLYLKDPVAGPTEVGTVLEGLAEGEHAADTLNLDYSSENTHVTLW